MLRVIFVVPLVQLLILGYAITTDVKNLDIMICDLDRSSVSRELIKNFLYNEYFKVHFPGEDSRFHAEKYLFEGKAVVALIIPENFGKDLINGNKTEVQVLLDGQNSNTSAIALGYCNRILYRYMQNYLKLKLKLNPLMARKIKRIGPVTRIWYNPELKSVYFMIPGIISILLSIITMLLTSLAIVKEREIGTLEQLLVTPLKSWQIIAGKIIPFAILGYCEIGIALLFGVLWFKIPVVGSILVLSVLISVFILTTLGLGIFISTLVNTQQQALFISWFFLVTFILLSGFFYPVENMPGWVQIITNIDPLKYFIIIIRELFLKGAGFNELKFEFAALLTIGITVFTVAILRFHKRME